MKGYNSQEEFPAWKKFINKLKCQVHLLFDVEIHSVTSQTKSSQQLLTTAFHFDGIAFWCKKLLIFHPVRIYNCYNRA